MDFFDKLGKTATSAYKITADKTGKLAKGTKLKLKIGELKSQISDIYEEIGEKVYEKHIREEEISIKDDLEEFCIKIDVLSDEIDGLLKQCMDLKDKKQCPKCFKEIKKEDNYCPNCGQKQEIEELDESFKGKEDRFDQDKNNDNNQESEKEMNNNNQQSEQDEYNYDNNQSNQETNDNNQQSEQEEYNDDNNQENEGAKTDLEKTTEIEINPQL